MLGMAVHSSAGGQQAIRPRVLGGTAHSAGPHPGSVAHNIAYLHQLLQTPCKVHPRTLVPYTVHWKMFKHKGALISASCYFPYLLTMSVACMPELDA